MRKQHKEVLRRLTEEFREVVQQRAQGDQSAKARAKMLALDIYALRRKVKARSSYGYSY